MAERRIEHTFDCDPEAYWELFFSPEFNQSLFIERLRFQRWEVTSTEPTAHGFKRALEAEPPTPNLPGPLKAALRSGVGYREEGEFRRDESTYTLRAISKSLPERLNITSKITVVSEGVGCRRIYLAAVVAKVFGIGGMLEERVLSDLEYSVNKSADHTKKWLEGQRGS